MSQHARKKTIDVEDVRLGCTMVRERNQTRPPARLLLSQLARSKNRTALPVPGVRHGVRLPPDRFCLTANNFRYQQEADGLGFTSWVVKCDISTKYNYTRASPKI